jgi:hypothetical protein
MSRRSGVGWATELLGSLLAESTDHGRLVRGKELFDVGRVVGLDIRLGEASASLIGSRLAPYDVSLRVPVDGRPTRASQLHFSCTCPDWGDPCKHGVALALALGDELDHDPALAERLWGSDDRPRWPAQPEPLTAPAPAARPLPVDRPTWAEDLHDRRPAASVDEWLGLTPPLRPAPGRDASRRPAPPDPLTPVLSLGPLLAGDGWDLAPAIELLLLGLVDRPD